MGVCPFGVNVNKLVNLYFMINFHRARKKSPHPPFDHVSTKACITISTIYVCLLSN